MGKMITFPRLAAMSKDPDVIMDAIESFGNGQLMEVDRDLCRIRRNPRYLQGGAKTLFYVTHLKKM